MKFSISFLLSCCLLAGVESNSSAGTGNREERFADFEPRKASSRNRAEVVAQLPGGSGLLPEAPRYRDSAFKQLDLPTMLWCSDFMKFVKKNAGVNGAKSSARSFPEFGRKIADPRLGAIAIFTPPGPQNSQVGIVRGTDGQDNPIIIYGSAKMVRQSAYPKDRVLAYVMPPDYVLGETASAERAVACIMHPW